MHIPKFSSLFRSETFKFNSNEIELTGSICASIMLPMRTEKEKLDFNAILEEIKARGNVSLYRELIRAARLASNSTEPADMHRIEKGFEHLKH